MLQLLNPVPEIDYGKYNKQLIGVREKIALLKGACFGLPNPQLLLSPTVLREAIASSEIENIATTLASVMQAQLLPDSALQQPDKEVLRYNKALNEGLALMETLPLGSRVINTIHDALLPNQNGFRKDQNVVVNLKTKEVIYTPPSAEVVPDLITDLEKFIHAEEPYIDPVIKTIISHYQFEAIHPYGDGNGRTGRILMILCLMHYGLLDMPVLFISGYINSHKQEYYSALHNVTVNKDWDTYLDYMLTAFEIQAEQETTTLLKITELHDIIKREIRSSLPKIYSRDLVDAIFNKPWITPSAYSGIMGVIPQTATTHLKNLERIGIMTPYKIGRHMFYVNTALFNLLDGRAAGQ